MSRLPFLWSSVTILLILFITFSITNIFFSLPIPHLEEESHEDEHGHDSADMDTPHIRMPPQPPYTFPPSRSAVHAAIAASSAVLEQLSTLAPENATVENVLLPLAASEASLTGLLNTLTILSLAAPDETTSELLIELNEHVLRTSTHPAVPPLITALHDHGVVDPETERYLYAIYMGLMHSGSALSAEQQRRLEVMQEGLANLTATFQQNLITANSTLSMEYLNTTGIPENMIPADGVIDLTPGTVSQLLTTAADSETRRAIWAAAENSVPANIPVFKELITTRHEVATLLGYDSWASLRLSSGSGRIMPDADSVRSFLADAREAIMPVAIKEVFEIEEVLGEDYHLWDKRYAEKLRERSEGAGMVFEVEEVLEKVLGVWGEVLGVEFMEVDRDMWDAMRGVKMPAGMESGWDAVRDGDDAARGMAWHEDVKIFAVWDVPKKEKRHGDHDETAGPGSKGFIGYLYLDLLARPSKTAQAGNLNVTPGHHHPGRPRHYPSTSVLTTFPSSGRLTHADLVLLFHELGHAMHDLLSTTQFARHHGPAGTPVDFAEVPSRVGEEFAWDVDVLVSLGAQQSHAEAVVGGRWEGAALSTLRGVHIAAFDMAVHGATPPEEADLVGGVYNSLRRVIIPVAGGEAGERLDGYTTFGHLASGYDGGYYGYLVSSCWAADVWGVFGRGGGSAWRGVLEAGGGRDVRAVVGTFLGGEPGCGVFWGRLGVEGEGKEGEGKGRDR